MIDGKITHRDFIKLSDRLMMSAKMVTKGIRVADVGCDHAHTDIWLVKEGIAKHAIAMDVGEGPLSHASANIRLYGLENQIETRLSYGLDELQPGEVDCVVIAGMGGTLTTCILNKGRKVLEGVQELVLQPQSDIWMVRRFLREHGFVIVDEDMCIEDGKYYNSMRAIRRFDDAKAGPDSDSGRYCSKSDNGMLEERNPMSADDVWMEEFACREKDLSENEDVLMKDEFGEILLEKKHPVLKQHLESLLIKNNRVLESICSMGGDTSDYKRRYFEKEKVLLELALQKIN